ncbi:MAG: hypothetical protein JRM73_00395 [Nitrososphaerota archaeon]|nr:hypothetical protein [Nitrososphaerota archaeon]
MKLASLQYFGVSAWRLACLGVAFSSAMWLGGEAVAGGVLGEGRPVVLALMSGAVFYLVVTTPRRAMERQRDLQSRESLLLSVSARACLAVTGSRARTLLMLRSKEEGTERAMRAAARLVLLGTRVEVALGEASNTLVSLSAAAAFRGLASLRPEGIEGGDEESKGLASARELSRETKVPMLMTVCFFSPILMVLYAVFSQSYSLESVSELAALELIVVDLAYFLTSSQEGR